MKKIINFILLIFLMVLPLKVNAEKISNVKLTLSKEPFVGEEFSIIVGINFHDLSDYNGSLGVAAVVYELEFDDSIFTILGTDKNDFDSDIYISDGKYYILSYIDETKSTNNRCVDGVLYCKDYIQTINFSTKDTNIDKTKIKIDNVNVALLPIGSDYEEDDIVIINGPSYSLDVTVNRKQVSNEDVNIKEPDNIVSKPTNNDIISDTKPNINNAIKEHPITNNITIDKKDSNNYLSSIEIVNYNIDFDKDKFEYNIDIDESVNELDVKAISESRKAKIDIKGNNNLKENNYKIIIDVTAEDNNLKTYTININPKKEEKIEIIKDKTDKSKVNKKGKFKISNKTKNIIIICLIILVLIITIISIICYKKDKEMDKQIDKYL